MIYLDHNATTPLCAAARVAMEPWWAVPANPFSAHAYGRHAAAAVDDARARVAALFGWEREGVVFTSGATEANTTVLSRGRWIVSAVEHPSALTWGAEQIPVDADGVVRLDVLDAALSRGAVDGVSVMAANNETGVLQPIAAVRAIARRHGVLLHVDASQLPGRVEPAVDADFVTISAHKMGGPQGVGALLVRRGVRMEPLLPGPQERARRGGTPNVAGIVGMGAAAAGSTLLPDLRDRLERGLGALGGVVAGAGAPRLPNTSSVAFAGIDAGDLVMALDLAGVATSVGSACASGSPEPSHVLRAMGFHGSAVRFSTGAKTTQAEIDAAIAAVSTVIARL